VRRANPTGNSTSAHLIVRSLILNGGVCREYPQVFREGD
jgi:hypothetical protein